MLSIQSNHQLTVIRIILTENNKVTTFNKLAFNNYMFITNLAIHIKLFHHN
jgi:hypothetical protein